MIAAEKLVEMRDNVQRQVLALTTKLQQVNQDMHALSEHHQLLTTQRNSVIGELTAASAALQAFNLALGDDAAPASTAPPSEPLLDTAETQ